MQPLELCVDDLGASPQRMSTILTQIEAASGIDFSGIMECELGVSGVKIHWPATLIQGGVTGRLFAKQFEVHETPHVVICADLSKSTQLPFGSPKKENIFWLADTLGNLAIQAGCIVQIIGFSGGVDFASQYAMDRRSLQIALELLKRTQAREHVDTNLMQALNYVGVQYQQKSLIIVISDFFSPLDIWKNAWMQLVHQHAVMALAVSSVSDERIPGGLAMFTGTESGAEVLAFGARKREGVVSFLAQLAREYLVDFGQFRVEDGSSAHNDALAEVLNNRQIRISAQLRRRSA
jgi:hypothetical protein